METIIEENNLIENEINPENNINFINTNKDTFKPILPKKSDDRRLYKNCNDCRNTRRKCIKKDKLDRCQSCIIRDKPCEFDYIKTNRIKRRYQEKQLNNDNHNKQDDIPDEAQKIFIDIMNDKLKLTRENTEIFNKVRKYEEEQLIKEINKCKDPKWRRLLMTQY